MISVPSKTFLLGEYLVLQGGEGLVALTEPRFEMLESENTVEFPEGSPADQLLKNRNSQIKGEFSDPHQGQGGFGASTAQYISALALADKTELKSLSTENLKQLWEEYRGYAWTGQGPKPSGVDFVAQITGELCSYNTSTGELQSFKWPFADKSFLVFRTGFKVKTHEHLSELGSLDTSKLAECYTKGIAALDQKSWLDFCASINDYAKELEKLNLTHPSSLKICSELRHHCLPQAVKPCGALGADTILVCCEKEKEAAMVNYAETLGLKLACSDSDLTNGLEQRLDS